MEIKANKLINKNKKLKFEFNKNLIKTRNGKSC